MNEASVVNSSDMDADSKGQITDYIDAKKFKINGKARARVGGE